MRVHKARAAVSEGSGPMRPYLLLKHAATLAAMVCGCTTSYAQGINKSKCITDQFANQIAVERYFKGFVYDGMLAECQLSNSNNAAVRSYIAGFQSGFAASGASIVETCGVSPEDLLQASFTYAAAMRRAGALSLWRLVDAPSKASTCAGILTIIENKME